VLEKLGLDPQNITIHYYNEATSAWKPLPTVLNETGGYVEANITHLSVWSIFGSNAPPSKVTGLKVKDLHDGKLKISWDPATDDTGVEHYNIYRDGILLATTIDTSYTDTGLTNGQSYTYEVSAVDTSGLEGEKSEPAVGTPTASSPPSPPPILPPQPSNKSPIADAGPDQSVFVNRIVYFDGSGSRDPDGSIVSYSWTFGDGDSASGVTISHVYTSAGTYTVTLTVTDNAGATDSDTSTITVEALPLPPKAGIDEGVAANVTDHVIDALEEANTTVTVNTTDPVTITVLTYAENPYPDVPLPENALPIVVDISVSNPKAVSWPIYVERHYTDEAIAGLDESRFSIYYYKDGAWHMCRETGVYPNLNVVWANMYEDEVTGSPTVIGEAPASAAEFELSGLSVSPAQVGVGESVTVSATVTNVGEDSGSYTVTLKVDGVAVDSETVTLDGGASTSVRFTVTSEVEGSHTVEVDGLTGSFTATIPPSSPQKPFPWNWVVVIFTVLAIVVLVVFFIIKRR